MTRNCYNQNKNLAIRTKVDKTEITNGQMSLVVRKPVFGVSDQVRHKPGCAATENGQRLEISDLGRGIVLSV